MEATPDPQDGSSAAVVLREQGRTEGRAAARALAEQGLAEQADEVTGAVPGVVAPVAVSRRNALVFGIVSIALFMSSIDQTIIATALSAIQHDLHSRLNWSGWTITVYGLGLVVAMPVAGKMSDLYGRKTIFLTASIVFCASSLACGLAGNIDLLIILRFVQALGGGAFMPSATGIVADQFGESRDRAVAMFTSILPIGGIVGPILGGILVSYWSWRMIFLINVPLGIVLIILTVKFLPSSERREAARLDRVGVALLGVMILASMFGFAFLGTGTVSATSWKFWGFEALGIAGLIVFLRHIRSTANPLVPEMLLYGRGFGVVNTINLIYGSAALGLPALVPLYAEQRYGMSTLHASTLLTARALGMIAVAGIASMTMRRTGVRTPMAIGFVLIMIGLLLLAYRPAGVSAYLWLSLAAGVTGLGMGSAVPATNNASLQLAPEHVAAIAGLRGMFRQSGAIFALSVSTAILATARNPGVAEARIFTAFAGILLLTLPLTVLVPDHRGRW